MTGRESIPKLEARLQAIEARIAEMRRSSDSTGTPFGDTEWADILAAHTRLSARIADERDHDAHAIERLRADIEALALSLDDWLKSIDRTYASQQLGARKSREGGS